MLVWNQIKIYFKESCFVELRTPDCSRWNNRVTR